MRRRTRCRASSRACSSATFLARIDPARGRFRAYLRTALAHHLANEHERATAQKRGGALAPILTRLRPRRAPPRRRPAHPEQAFEREWALGVLERALGAPARRVRGRRRQGPFALVTAFFGTGTTPPSYADAAAHTA
jgi:RNA polymerase sigma-70 factor (ECF subfamily)